jgi:predicted DNA-binding protein (UPF0251 family)
MNPTLNRPTRRRYHSVDAILARAGASPTDRRRAAERQGDLAVAAELEWLRCAARLTQGEVARRMGVSQSTVSRLQATPAADLRLGEILSFLRAVGAETASIELTPSAGRRPAARLSVPGRGGR